MSVYKVVENNVEIPFTDAWSRALGSFNTARSRYKKAKESERAKESEKAKETEKAKESEAVDECEEQDKV
jgi:hypothetical protein